MKLRLEPGTKLKAAPVEYRVALRLVTFAERKAPSASVTQIAKEIGDSVPMVMQAIDALVEDKHIEVVAFSPTSMLVVYLVDKKTRTALIKDASAYNNHLVAVANRPPPKPQGARLPPIDTAMRATFMKVAKPLAKAMLARETEHVTWQLAGCIARIGLENVEALVKATLAVEPALERGTLKPFFEQYVLKRDEAKKLA